MGIRGELNGRAVVAPPPPGIGKLLGDTPGPKDFEFAGLTSAALNILGLSCICLPVVGSWRSPCLEVAEVVGCLASSLGIYGWVGTCVARRRGVAAIRETFVNAIGNEGLEALPAVEYSMGDGELVISPQNMTCPVMRLVSNGTTWALAQKEEIHDENDYRSGRIVVYLIDPIHIQGSKSHPHCPTEIRWTMTEREAQTFLSPCLPE